MNIVIDALVIIMVIAAVLALAAWVVSKSSPISFGSDDDWAEDFETTEDDFPEFWDDDSWYVRATGKGYEYNPNYTE